MDYQVVNRATPGAMELILVAPQKAVSPTTRAVEARPASTHRRRRGDFTAARLRALLPAGARRAGVLIKHSAPPSPNINIPSRQHLGPPARRDIGGTRFTEEIQNE